jgi:single-strand DNA-binding protein
MNLNSVVITGNLTRDPELRQLPSGTPVCDLRVAVNDRRKQANGEWGDVAYYFDVSVFGAQGENCATYLAKGRPVGIQGKLTWREWEAQDGSGKRQAVSIVADSVQFLGSGEGNGNQQAAPAQQRQAAPQQAAPPVQQQQQQQTPPAEQPVGVGAGDDDDGLPF